MSIMDDTILFLEINLTRSGRDLGEENSLSPRLFYFLESVSKRYLIAKFKIFIVINING